LGTLKVASVLDLTAVVDRARQDAEEPSLRGSNPLLRALGCCSIEPTAARLDAIAIY
jgi:hypothetical protein